jgi:hypothetical protein
MLFWSYLLNYDISFALCNTHRNKFTSFTFILTRNDGAHTRTRTGYPKARAKPAADPESLQWILVRVRVGLSEISSGHGWGYTRNLLALSHFVETIHYLHASMHPKFELLQRNPVAGPRQPSSLLVVAICNNLKTLLHTCTNVVLFDTASPAS